MLARRVAAHAPRRLCLKHSQQWNIRHRQMSTAASHAAQNATAHPLLAAIASELDRRGPRIDIHPRQVRIISGPKDFYQILKEKIRGAKHRIFLATLYFGTAENELIDCIREALRKSPHLQVSILTDALRGTREAPAPSCASLLAALEEEFPDQVEVRMYHTSNLTGLRKRLVPKRVNEGWGLQHMKLYGFDDEVILSGANLSSDYFIDRQDRYHLYSSKEATDYYSDIHQALCKLSFRVYPDDNPSGFTLSWPSDNKLSLERDAADEKLQMIVPSPLEDPCGYDKATESLFAKLIAPPSTPAQPSSTGTSLYPIVILPRAHNTELPVLQYLFTRSWPRGSSYLFTAGYFNPHPAISSLLLGASSAQPDQPPVLGTVLTASPWANGFYGSKGVSGLLPGGYTILARRFLDAVDKTCAPGMLRLREWRLGTVGRPHGWTYHAKGLWFTLASAPEQIPTGPCITLIGSSNYTVRSHTLDAEAGAVLVTRDPGLQSQLAREQATLLEHTREVLAEDLRGGSRRVGPFTHIALWMVSAAGGSL